MCHGQFSILDPRCVNSYNLKCQWCGAPEPMINREHSPDCKMAKLGDWWWDDEAGKFMETVDLWWRF